MLGKRISIGAAALAGAFALTACGTTGSTAAPAANGGTGAGAAEAPAPAAPAAAKTSGTPRCTTADLSVALGKPKEKSPGQYDLRLTYQNLSDHTCGLYGVPGVDLVGPDDPAFGAVYHLPRIDNGVKYNEVTPGTTASATITVLTPDGGHPPGHVCQRHSGRSGLTSLDRVKRGPKRHSWRGAPSSSVRR